MPRNHHGNGNGFHKPRDLRDGNGFQKPRDLHDGNGFQKPRDLHGMEMVFRSLGIFMEMEMEMKPSY